MKIKNNYSIMQRVFVVVLFCCFAMSQLFAQLCLGTKVRPTDNPEEVLVDVNSENFEGVLSLQLSLRYDPAVYEFVDFEGSDLPGFNATNFSVNAPNFSANNINGLVGIVWFDATVTNGGTLTEEEVIATFKFKKLIDFSAEFTISNDPIIVEATDVNFGLLNVDFCNDSTSLVSYVDGKFILDENNNCTLDPDEVEVSKKHNWQGWTITTTNNGEDFYYSSITGEGLFQLQLFPNINQVTVFPPNPYYSLCSSTFTIDPDQKNLSDVLQVFAQIETYCPLMSVETISPPVESCAESAVFITYGNYGTQLAEDAYLEVALDKRINLVGSSLDYTQLENDKIRIELGDVAVGQTEFVSLETTIDCDVEEGETLCNEIQIFPAEFCGELDRTWSGASLKVEGQCIGEEIIFEIENIGDADMSEPSEFVVIEDAIIFKMHTVQLEQGTKEQIRLAANGSTYRVQVDQVQGHPGNSKPTAFVEGCGLNQDGAFSKGFVQVFPNDESNFFISIDCQQVGDSYAPSTLNAVPRGVGTERFIKADDYLEYQIYFQESSKQIVIIDTLSSMLDLTTFQPITSSKPYLYQISDAGIVQFIMPADELTQLLGTNFIQFKIRPKTSTPNGSIISNSASIYSGLRAPSQTNTVFHTVGENFLESIVTNTVDFNIPNAGLIVSPNPSNGEVLFTLKDIPDKQSTITIYNTFGTILYQIPLNNGIGELPSTILDAGIYFYQLRTEQQFLTSGTFSIIK